MIKVINPIVSNVVLNEPLVWDSLFSADLHQIVNAVYDEIVYWRKNLFMLPSGSTGRSMSVKQRDLSISGMRTLDIHSISLKLLMIMPALLLQKPTFKSKSK